MATTIFSNERNTYSTIIEGETLRMTGEATIGSGSTRFQGQILRKADGDYIGDYSTNNISINPAGRMGYWIEAATLMEQLASDVESKAQEATA